MADERTEHERLFALICLILGSFALGMLLAPSRKVIIGSYNGCGYHGAKCESKRVPKGLKNRNAKDEK